MSYDLTIATHEKPATDLIQLWAADQGFEVVAAPDGGSFTIQRAAEGEHGFVCEVWGPDAAEAEDFDESLAAACLAPRWMLLITTPYSVPKVNLTRAKSLTRFIAERMDGAAYDPQEEKLIWPRGKQARTPPRSAAHETLLLELDWFVAPSRWQRAVESLIPLLERRAREALPTRYGRWEPPPNRFDPTEPQRFVDFGLDKEDSGGFWFAKKPSFGGSFIVPYANRRAKPEDEPFQIGRVSVDFDGKLIAEDARWREVIVDLFVRGAEAFGAFFAAAQISTGWTVTTGNRLWSSSRPASEHFLRGTLWQGLPPIPVWMSFYGDPYRELVERPLARFADADDAAGSDHYPRVGRRATGIAVRLSETPLPRSELPEVGLPEELTYRERPRVIQLPNGGSRSNHAQPEDRATLIPKLEVPAG